MGQAVQENLTPAVGPSGIELQPCGPYMFPPHITTTFACKVTPLELWHWKTEDVA